MPPHWSRTEDGGKKPVEFCPTCRREVPTYNFGTEASSWLWYCLDCAAARMQAFEDRLYMIRIGRPRREGNHIYDLAVFMGDPGSS